MFTQLERLIDAYKAERSHLRRLVVSGATVARLHTGVVTLGGIVVEIQPFQVSEITAPPAPIHVGAGQYSVGTITIYPRTP
jgi:P2-related tail formation protein